eukprot:CAMPEP_0178582552 /NCGR_PEP_ID=MMETSP0697-20121206/23788_1 /TAXON_ID=265572 /ORGANISM="Extubocellulus spinifer, Strain CCMP396" /LENGTH=420 /DNA_ID=CAMNT_0020218297 /DNA_START=337 /DNA_END=1596 /DNA_ORIENTATION=-
MPASLRRARVSTPWSTRTSLERKVAANGDGSTSESSPHTRASTSTQKRIQVIVVGFTLLISLLCIYVVIHVTLHASRQDKHTSEPCMTFVGDTMLANKARDYSSDFFPHPRESFEFVGPLLRNCSVVVANLEGPISKLGLEHDPKHSSPNYSFNMDPDVIANLLADQGITHANMANNHLLDRGDRGVKDTIKALDAAGLRHFGSGPSKEKAAEPMIVDARDSDNSGNPLKVGVTGFSDMYNRGVLPDAKKSRTGVLTVTSEHARLGCKLLDEQDVGLRIAYVHWGANYRPVSLQMRAQAKILVDEGRYDLIIGSDGCHCVHPFEYVRGIPVLYNVGNFIFHTPGRFYKNKRILPYGLVVHVNFDRAGFASLELHCLHVDNKVVKFQSKICNGEQAASLFSTMGPHIVYHYNNTYATVYLK